MIFKIKRKARDFFQCSNAVIEDKNLSFKAKGVLCYLLSKPDTWTPRVGELASVGPDGKESIQSALKELRKFGYAVLEVERSADGRTTGTFWQVFEAPDENRISPLVGNTVGRENPSTVKPATSNTDLKATLKEKEHIEQESFALKEDQEEEKKENLTKEIQEAWNEIEGFQRALDMTPCRVRILKTRLRDKWWRENWREGLEIASNIDWLKGKNDRKWKANMNWFLREDTLTKIMEGSYGGGDDEGDTRDDAPNYPPPPRRKVMTEEDRARSREMFRQARIAMGMTEGMTV